MLWETLLELARHLAAAPPAIAAPVVPGTTTAADIKPECVEPHQHTYSGWSLDGEDRKFEGQWVLSTKYYSRTVTDSCDGTTTTEYRTEGPTRLWPAVPDQRVADVNRPSGTDDAVTGTPLRSSNLPSGMQGAPAVGPQDLSAANKPSLPDSNKPAAPKGWPFYPGALLLVGVVVAAWQQKRFGGGGGTAGGQGPDPEQELLDWKVKQFQSLAQRGRWDARNPQLKDDAEFAGHTRPWESLKPETQDTLRAWQKQWDSVAGYWERFFGDVDGAVGTPPVDPWGLGDIARAQAAEALQGKLSQFRLLVDRMAANPDEFDDLSPALQDLARSIEHFKSVLPLEKADSLTRDAFAGDEAVVGQLVVDLKKQQYRELAQAGRFDQDNPQFVDDARYRPFALLKPAWLPGTEQTVTANQSAWKDAAHYWHARLSGGDGGAEPDDVLGVGQFARARVVAAKRQKRWEDEDQTLDTMPKGTALDQKRMSRWAKVDEGTEDSDLSPDDWAYINMLLDGTGDSLDDLGDRDQWAKGVPGRLNLPGAFIKEGVNYSQLISDDVFTDYKSMTESDIRQFINSFPHNVIKDPNMPVWEYADDNKTKRNSGRTVDVAHLIYLCSRAFQINPKVLLTKLEKEEALLSGMWQGEQIQPDWKMMMLASGFGVTDGQQQTKRYEWSGIDRQIVLAAWLTRLYFNDMSNVYPAPKAYPVDVPTGEGPVPVFNRATWVLYLYTPHTITSDGQGNIAFINVWDQYFGKGTRVVN